MVSCCPLSCRICGRIGKWCGWLFRTDRFSLSSHSSRTSGSTSIGPFPLGPIVLSLSAAGLSTGGSCCPVMSSYEKSPSCSCRSPSFFHASRDEFMGRLVILVKWSHLESCTLDSGIAVGNPNCGQRVADDSARVPKSVCWFLGCIRSVSPGPKGLSNM